MGAGVRPSAAACARGSRVPCNRGSVGKRILVAGFIFSLNSLQKHVNVPDGLRRENSKFTCK